MLYVWKEASKHFWVFKAGQPQLFVLKKIPLSKWLMNSVRKRNIEQMVNKGQIWKLSGSNWGKLPGGGNRGKLSGGANGAKICTRGHCPFFSIAIVRPWPYSLGLLSISSLLWNYIWSGEGVSIFLRTSLPTLHKIQNE